MPTEPQKRSRPRLTNAELRVLYRMLFLKDEGHYDKTTHRFVYDKDIHRKLGQILTARKAHHAN